MKIAFDGKRAVQNLTGLGNYSRLIIESIGREFPDDRLLIYAPRRRENPRLAPILKLPNATFIYPTRTPLGKSYWRTYGITKELRASGADIYHGLSNELPLNITQSGLPSVLTMHDVIYRTMPSCYSRFDRLIYDIKYGASCRRATRIIAISECTKRDIMRFYGINEEKIDVIYQGIDPQFRQQSLESTLKVRRELALPERYLIQVGSIEERKNALESVRALSALPEDISLVLIGRATPYLDLMRKEAEKLGVAARLRVIHNAGFSLLPALYSGAVAALYPSRYEGFGLPVVEALACGTPVIAATGSCLEEAGGKGSIYVSPDDPAALARAVEAAMTPSRSRQMRELGLAHAARFAEADPAARTHEVYLRAINEHLINKKSRR